MPALAPAEIETLESALDALLPRFRTWDRPSPELLEAAERWSEAVWAAAEAAGPFSLDPENRERGCRLAARPVFICGLHRSGTTLVRDLLDGHPQLGVLPAEGSFLTSLQDRMESLPQVERLAFLGREWLRRLANPTNQAPFWLLGRTEGCSSPYLLFTRLLLAWWPAVQAGNGIVSSFQPLVAVALAYLTTLHHGAVDATVRYWVEKTPTNEFYLDRLWAEFPRARIVHVLRDPLSIYASRKRLEQRVFGTFKSRRVLLRDLARSFDVAARHAAEPRYYLVRYEQLVERPAQVMAQLAHFLNIDFHDSLLRPTVASLPSCSNSSFATSPQPGSIVPFAAHGRDVLTSLERQLVAAHVGDLASLLGYPVEHLGSFRTALLRAGMRLWLALGKT